MDPAVPPHDPAGLPPEARFDALALRAELLEVLRELGYEEPTPIQQRAIPVLLDGHDVLGQAATGTGKTAAFALPILERLGPPRSDAGPRALVLVPTRELAMQVSQAVHTYGRRLGTRVLPVYGGQPIWRQLTELRRGVDVVVATPGRAVDHLDRGSLRLDDVEVVVLDEADEMLDLGFADDLDAVLAAVPAARQTMLFSATLPPRITGLAARQLRDPRRIEVGADRAAREVPALVRQRAYVVRSRDKVAALGRLLDIEVPDAALVFCGTRVEVDSLTEVMNGRGYRAEALHGGMDQAQRDRVMERLRGRVAELVVATDVAARGLDIDHLSHVVNYDVPSAPDTYVHRIGRVGRAGRHGVAITLLEPRQTRLLRAIEQHTNQRIDVAPIPSSSDLQARRLERTEQALRERIRDGELERFAPVLATLGEDRDLYEVALAAVALVHEGLTGSASDDVEFPELELHSRRERGRGSAEGRSRPSSPGRGGRRQDARKPRSSDTARIYIGLGREHGIRPADLVGAIANESKVSGTAIGAIEITPRFSLVEVPREALDEVVSALRRTSLRGRRATVRPDRFAP